MSYQQQQAITDGNSPRAGDSALPPSYESQPPPSYDSVADPPPTYDSIFGNIQQAREESSNTMDFLKKFLILLGSTAGCTACLAFFFAFPLACIVIGVIYFNECPAERYIPIYLVVLGSFGILRNFVGLYSQIKTRTSDNDGDEANKKRSSFEHCISCFLILWFIAGNVWIYSIYPPIYERSGLPNVDPVAYCNKTLYLFAFWLTTASYIVIGLMCFCMCCVAFCAGVAED